MARHRPGRIERQRIREGMALDARECEIARATDATAGAATGTRMGSRRDTTKRFIRVTGSPDGWPMGMNVRTAPKVTDASEIGKGQTRTDKGARMDAAGIARPHVYRGNLPG
jgi:hypothetical protein